MKPVRVGELKYIKSIAATTDYAYALDEKGTVLRWGRDLSRIENVPIFDVDADMEGETMKDKKQTAATSTVEGQYV